MQRPAPQLASNRAGSHPGLLTHHLGMGPEETPLGMAAGGGGGNGRREHYFLLAHLFLII